MKFTFNWLKDHLETDKSLEEILESLIKIGIEVEDVINYQERLKEFTVGYVKTANKHPNADKLRVCEVETIDGKKQIVCGAHNAREGIYIIYSPIGSYIPGLDFTLKEAQIRGVDSQGMMVSEKELCISEEHDGIIEFSEGEIGQSASSILGLDDIMIEVSITPNRGDLLGVRGIAKDLAGFGIGTLKPLIFEVPKTIGETNIKITSNNDVSDKFAIQKIKGVKNIQSPKWLQNRLQMIGVQSRSALIDITNYICFDLNQPMHCYDLDKINISEEITLDLDQNNTDYLALDGNEYKLSKISPVVVFDKQIGAIAGIKGSLDSSTSEETTNILLEAAHFNHKIVSLAKRELNINTDSSYRFEREIDFENIELALNYAAYLINRICGGEFYNPSIYALKRSQREITFDLSYVNILAGISLTIKEVEDILQRADFNILQAGEVFKVIPPSNRNDIDEKSVIVAEILRFKDINTLENISLIKNINENKRAFDDNFQRTLIAKRSLAQAGLLETINMSFISKELGSIFDIIEEELLIENPISEDLSLMRKSLVPSLVNVAINNMKMSYNNLRLFEFGFIYKDSEIQEPSVAGILTGSKINTSWQTKLQKYNAFDAKAIVFNLINNIGFDPEKMQIKQQDLPSYYHSGKAASLNMGKNAIAYFGELHPRVIEALNIKEQVIIFEVFLEKMPQIKQKSFAKPFLELYDFMPFSRDFSFIVEEKITAGEVIRLTKATDKKHITQVEVFDIYQGDNIAQGKKSISIKVHFQPHNKTFTIEEINIMMDKIIANVAKGTGAVIRDS